MPLAERDEARCVMAGQFAHKPGDQDAACLRFAAQAKRHLNRQAERVVVLSDRFAGVCTRRLLQASMLQPPNLGSGAASTMVRRHLEKLPAPSAWRRAMLDDRAAALR